MAVVAAFLSVSFGEASSGLNVGPLWDVDEIAIEPVLVGQPLGLEGEKWAPLFGADRAASDAFRSSLESALAAHLRAGGLRVVAKSANVLKVEVFGGKRVGDRCNSSEFMVEVWVHKPHDESQSQTIISLADDPDLSESLTKAALQIVDGFVSLRTRYRTEARKKVS